MAAQEDTADLGQALSFIRIGMIASILIFGGVAWGLSVLKGAGLAPELVVGRQVVVWTVLGVLFLGLFSGILVVRSRWGEAEEGPRKQTLNIMGWAVAESGGLLGCIYLLLSGDPLFFGVGLALLVLTTFVLLPIPFGATR